MGHNGWNVIPIKELYEGLYDGPHATPKPSDAGPVFLGIKNVTDDGRLDLSHIRHIAEEDFPSLPPEVRGFEPRLALDGGKDGLNFFRRVLPRVGEFLNPGGWFLAEIGDGQGGKIRQIAEGNPEFVSCGFVRDLAGIERVFKARKK